MTLAVGEFMRATRITIPAEIDSTDLSTVVSIYPIEILEIKPTVQPGVFHILPGTYENPSVLVVGASTWWKETSPEDPLIEIPHLSLSVARSIVQDYCNSMFMYSNDSRVPRSPGLFFIKGKKTSEDIKKEFKIQLINAKTAQENWFRELIKTADSLWAKSNGNPLVISDQMRMAASQLSQDKPWLYDYVANEVERCIACGEMKPVSAVVCSNCKVITNPKRAAELGLKFAQ